jgi:hypothetical protein
MIVGKTTRRSAFAGFDEAAKSARPAPIEHLAPFLILLAVGLNCTLHRNTTAGR